jgi:two-component sensor histidine kinase
VDIAVLDREVARQQAMLDAITILADITRSDVFFLDGLTPDRFTVEAHAQPHSIISLYSDNQKGHTLYPEPDSAIVRAFKSRKPAAEMIGPGDERSGTACREAWPVIDRDRQLIGVLVVETARVEYENQQRRKGSMPKAIYLLKDMVARGDLRGTTALSRGTASEGMLLVGRDLRIHYANSIAQEIYERVGVGQSLTRMRLGALETSDDILVAQAFESSACVEREETVREAIWVRRALPLIDAPSRGTAWTINSDKLPPPRAVLLLVRDVTVQRMRQEDLQRLERVSKEIHHRVKNNLQQIISLTRFESRRAQQAETKRALDDLSNRIFAVAQVHEYLSAGNLDEIQLKDVCKQIAIQMRDNLLPRDSRISIEVEGDPLKLDPRQATLCALIVNELVQNAVEHAFDEKGGIIRIQLEDSPERVRIAVVDNGRGLPPGFEWRHSNSLGLKIVHMMVPDLHAELRLRNQEGPAHGLVAQFTFTKALSKGK